MNVLWLTPPQARALVQHALDATPYEACGLISGSPQGQAAAVIPIPNRAAQPEHQYELDRSTFVQAMFELQRSNEALIGIYHSHPHTDAVPSPTDQQQATYPDAAYVIVSLQGETPRIAAWRLRYGQAEHLPLYISPHPPEWSMYAPLSRPQMIAIALSAILTLLALVALSVYLLPPAPPLPTPGG